MNNFEEARKLIEQSKDILFTTHERTDGDDLGSVLAIAQHCKAEGKTVTVVVTGGVPNSLSYLDGSDMVLEVLPRKNFDLLVVSGCSNIQRVGNEEIAELNTSTINFDHHPDNQNYGDINVVDHTKSSVAELVYDFFKANEWEFNHGIAQCLLTGIITDTGMLQHSNTQASTLLAASELMKYGARITQTAKHNFSHNSIEGLKAWSKALENSYFNPENQMIYSVITTQQLAELGNPELSVFEGVVETLNKVPEAKFAMFLKEDQGKIKGSLRSDPKKGVDVKEIAQKLGGGGHKWAAGFSMMGKLAKNQQGRWEIVKP